MLELRVLNGLQAGARLGLGEGDYLLGASADCDIVLAGPGVAPRLLTLSLEDGRVTVLPFDGAPFEAAPGKIFQAGDLHLAVDDAASPWPDDTSWLHVPADPPAAAAPLPGAGGASSLVRKARLGFVMVVTACGSSMLTVAVPTRSGVEARAPVVVRADPPPPRQLVVALADNTAIQVLPAVRPGEDGGDVPGYWGDERPSRAAGRRDERRGGERRRTASGGAGRLPFLVTQIVCGASPSVSTAEGVKLYEGGSYKGYRLERVSATQLRMQGARRSMDLPC